MNNGLDNVSTSESPARRKLLKALTAGGATAAIAPSEWTKPALKSVMLPAHAQSTGTGEDCARITGWGGGNGDRQCFSISVTGLLDASCGQGIGTVTVYRSDGSVWGNCFGVPAGADPGFLPSFSCSNRSELAGNQSTTNNIPTAGDVITVVAEFDNGCSCVLLSTVRT